MPTLPPPSKGDVFLDLEGYPLAKNGLEYLWGASTRSAGRGDCFHDRWAHDEASEKMAIEGFIDLAIARWKEDPAMHIYHYASYEVSAIKRLIGRHATREAEVDKLLRHGVFIDLYQVVKHRRLVAETQLLDQVGRASLSGQTRRGTLAVVVGDPRITTSPATNVPALRRLNLYCRLVREHAISTLITN